MRRAVLLTITLLAMPATAFATWSVIAVDRSTGRVVIASATCVDRATTSGAGSKRTSPREAKQFGD
jgi:hypothetical protein